ncbi:peptide-methionine (S)-S-oxide reductase MsrA [Mucilaginibacter aquatilis]|uniref:Peptide methionine sulfoxide reductase MsrA n=1 Tax=Mucilaginibacter aquatilis TaxID=1517760 RepID=A0A6I4IA00_9SPHI|nr:peptide-methionine (S)-S-oxide reductase MsrA [Mucilaginibacter aquatilis]MVN90306.1 peptide-methionine (S)-S-oxide reductase MsrA [Mucilaginibacter aquatilis]
MNLQKATFGGGCFWCTEAIFQIIKGVKSVVSGYMGGEIENPTYEQICGGKTGHAEVVEVEFDADEISYNDLLFVFFETHDATTLNRQGNDVGTQYRSVIYYHNKEQEQQAKEMVAQLTTEGIYSNPIVTEISPVGTLYTAESYHQNYFNNNTYKPYCTFVIQPKLNKFARKFTEKVKAGAV